MAGPTRALTRKFLEHSRFPTIKKSKYKVSNKAGILSGQESLSSEYSVSSDEGSEIDFLKSDPATAKLKKKDLFKVGKARISADQSKIKIDTTQGNPKLLPVPKLNLGPDFGNNGLFKASKFPSRTPIPQKKFSKFKFNFKEPEV